MKQKKVRKTPRPEWKDVPLLATENLITSRITKNFVVWDTQSQEKSTLWA